MKRFELHHGDCLEVLRTLSDASVDAVVTDPPYGLAFMGKKWDYDVPSVDVWEQCLRVLKPGGHLLCFAGTRTQHRMCCRIEDAGFEIRDMIAWVYGSGFPKSHNLSDEWQGWGTALKPAMEPITVARKPFKGTVAENVLTHGTGAINVDGCRISFASQDDQKSAAAAASQRACRDQNQNRTCYGNFDNGDASLIPYLDQLGRGRWPANLIHDGSEEAAEPLGSAARFFYCAKASKRDRDEGYEGFQERVKQTRNSFGDQSSYECPDGAKRTGDKATSIARNHHPTVKPTELMRYLCRMVTPPDGVVLDPFTGSGSTGKAAMLEGFRFIGIEREAEYIEIARARIEAATGKQLKFEFN